MDAQNGQEQDPITPVRPLDASGEAPAPAVKKFITRNEALESLDIEMEDVEVPEWGGWVVARALTGDQVDAYQKARLVIKGENQEINTAKARAQLVSMGTLCGDRKTKMFGTHGDVEKLGKKSNRALERVADVISRLSGLKKEAVKDAGETSGADPSATSTSD